MSHFLAQIFQGKSEAKTQQHVQTAPDILSCWHSVNKVQEPSTAMMASKLIRSNIKKSTSRSFSRFIIIVYRIP